MSSRDERVRRRAARLFAVSCVVVIGIQAVVIAHRRASHVGDFDISREFGRRLLAGEDLYAGGLHYPYSPTAALFFSPFALLPAGVGFVLRYAVALAALWLTLRLLSSLVRERNAGQPLQRQIVGALTLVLASQYVLRDLDDGGPHLILLGVLAGAIGLAAAERNVLAAAGFGLLAALKVNLGLFLPFLFWKRRWRLAGLAVAAALFWTILPIFWMGLSSWVDHQTRWAGVALASAAGRPIPGAAESERRVQNQALRPAVLRLAGARTEETVRASVAKIGDAAVAVVLAGFAWVTRRAHRDNDGERRLAEFSALAILAVLLSPIAWTQHFVFAIPAIYVIVAGDLGVRPADPWRWGALGFFAILAVALNREVLGRELSLQLLGWNIHTLAMGILLVLLALRPSAAPRDPRRMP